MDLYKRLIGYPYDELEGLAKIPFGPYIAQCFRQQAGDCTRAQIVSWYQLTTDEVADHDAIMVRVDAAESPLQRHEMEDILNFVEQGWLWTTPETLQARFGIA